MYSFAGDTRATFWDLSSLLLAPRVMATGSLNAFIQNDGVQYNFFALFSLDYSPRPNVKESRFLVGSFSDFRLAVADPWDKVCASFPQAACPLLLCSLPSGGLSKI